jgi:hypothetical protein
MSIVSLKAGESISAGDAVFVSSAGLLYKAIGQIFENASVAGVAINSGATGDLIRVNSDSIYTSSATFVPGEIQYLSALVSGEYANYDSVVSGLQSSSLAGLYLTEVGRAITTSKLNVERSIPFLLQNVTSVLLVEGGGGLVINAILQEDGSRIKTEDAV